MLEEIFKKTIKKYELLKKNDRIVLGISGGPDSICMMHLFVALRDEYKMQLACAHFNHCLRRESDEEEEFVKEQCKQSDIAFISIKKDVNKFFKGDSLEQTARNLRLDFFLSCARQFKSKKIALAHNKDDVAETILMRIIRGTALRGLRGILPKSAHKGVVVVRPLIETRKQEILTWLDNHHFEYRIDKSNLEEKFFRNKIRHTLLPILQDFNPNIVNTLSNLAGTVSVDYDFLQSNAQSFYDRLKKQRGRNYIRLETKEFQKMHPSLCVRILIMAIEELKGNARKLELRHFQEIIDLLYNRPVYSIVDLPDLEIKKEDKWLIIKSLLL